MRKLSILAIAMVLCWHNPATSTTWGPATVKDPIDTTKSCNVHHYLSYGSYIYGWPSKYDQVFWPMTDDR